jgi:hypothetical protein
MTYSHCQFGRYTYADKPNRLTPFPRREGEKFKASLLRGERFGERSKLYLTVLTTTSLSLYVLEVSHSA